MIEFDSFSNWEQYRAKYDSTSGNLIQYSDDRDYVKGGIVKQAEFSYNIRNGKAIITDFKNVATWKDIIKAIGYDNAVKYIENGVFFYSTNNDYVRVGTIKKNTIFSVGSEVRDIEFIINDMRIAGKRLSEFLNSEEITVVI